MGCASSVNVQIEENTDNRKILVDGKEVGNIKKNNNNEKKEEKSEENQDEDYIEMPTIKQSKNDNTESKTFVNSNTNKISGKHNIKINDKYYNSQSTNFKYLKDNKINLVKSNPIMKDKDNKIDEKNKNKFIPLKHPLDISSENRISELSKLKNLNISVEKEKLNDNIKDKNINNINKNNDINVMSSIEERINNYNGVNNNNHYEDEEEDGVNMGNNGNGDVDDDMCNFGQSMDFDKIKNKKNNEDENETKEICVIFEIQSTGVKYNININENVKLIELIELFKKKINLSSFEKPEFVFNTVFLVDFEKKISEYKIRDNSKINVFI